MPKDSQLDPKDIRQKKANGGQTMAGSALDGESRNIKKQSETDKNREMITNSLFKWQAVLCHPINS